MNSLSGNQPVNTTSMSLQQVGKGVSYDTQTGFFKLPNGNEYKITSLNGQAIKPGQKLSQEQVNSVLNLFNNTILAKGSDRLKSELQQKGLEGLTISNDPTRGNPKVATQIKGWVPHEHFVGTGGKRLSQDSSVHMQLVPQNTQARKLMVESLKNEYAEGLPKKFLRDINFQDLAVGLRNKHLTPSELKSVLSLNKKEQVLLKELDTKEKLPKGVSEKTLSSLMFKQLTLALLTGDEQAKTNALNCMIALEKNTDKLDSEIKHSATKLYLMMERIGVNPNDVVLHSIRNSLEKIATGS